MTRLGIVTLFIGMVSGSLSYGQANPGAYCDAGQAPLYVSASGATGFRAVDDCWAGYDADVASMLATCQGVCEQYQGYRLEVDLHSPTCDETLYFNPDAPNPNLPWTAYAEGTIICKCSCLRR